MVSVWCLTGSNLNWMFTWRSSSPRGRDSVRPAALRLTTPTTFPSIGRLDDSAVLFTSNRTGTSNIYNIFRQRIDETSAEMLVFGPEQKTISRLNPDGSQILYMVPPNPSDNGGQRRSELSRANVLERDTQAVRLMRVPISGGPPQTVLEAPYIVNYQCSRASADICVLSQAEPKQFVFSVFDSVKGNPREVAKLEESANGWNSGLSPDGTSIAVVTFSANDNRIRLISLSGTAHSRDHSKRLEQFHFPGLGSGRKGLFHFQQPDGPAVDSVVRGLDGQCALTLASEELPGHLGHSFSQWKIRGNSSTHRR